MGGVAGRTRIVPEEDLDVVRPRRRLRERHLHQPGNSSARFVHQRRLRASAGERRGQRRTFQSQGVVEEVGPTVMTLEGQGGASPICSRMSYRSPPIAAGCGGCVRGAERGWSERAGSAARGRRGARAGGAGVRGAPRQLGRLERAWKSCVASPASAPTVAPLASTTSMVNHDVRPATTPALMPGPARLKSVGDGSPSRRRCVGPGPGSAGAGSTHGGCAPADEHGAPVPAIASAQQRPAPPGRSSQPAPPQPPHSVGQQTSRPPAAPGALSTPPIAAQLALSRAAGCDEMIEGSDSASASSSTQPTGRAVCRPIRRTLARNGGAAGAASGRSGGAIVVLAAFALNREAF